MTQAQVSMNGDGQVCGHQVPAPLFFSRAGLCVPLVLPGLWEGDRALGTTALVVGLWGGVGAPAADPSQPPLFWDCHDTKDLERCGILSAAFRPKRPTW